MSRLARYRDALERADLHRRIGWVRHMEGLAIHASGPDAAVGELCRILPRTQAPSGGLLAEVVGLRGDRVILMPYGAAEGIALGCEVHALGAESMVGVGPELLGRVIDGFGEALDGLARPDTRARRALKAAPLNPMQRPPIDRVLETGIRCIDGLLTLGRGQRVGIFAGSGVGKSTLLGLLARRVASRANDAETDRVNVIAFIGERGREVREFVEKQLGPDGLAQSVVVVATSDQPALSRLRAAHAALSIAEHFRDQGRDVLLMMDSVTRYAMARREVGLSAGEPPTARGYTPSVFAELPELCERCGRAPGGGSITALFTVLVEGDDLNEPVSDALRSILDGHIVLSRHLAHQGHYPAIDVLKSVSRLMPDLADAAERALATSTLRLLSVLERNRQMVEIGAYESGTNPELDSALRIEPALQDWLRQGGEGPARADSVRLLRALLESPDATAHRP